MRLMRRLVPAIFVACLAGCKDSKDTELKLQRVTGKVIYDGRPAAGVRVTLIPVDAPGVPKIPQNPHAVTGADGTFMISTFGDGDGAAEGGYQVVLTWPPDPTNTEKGSKKTQEEPPQEGEDNDRLLGWYDPLHSRIEVRVGDGPVAIPVINIPKITGPPPVSQGVPGRN